MIFKDTFKQSSQSEKRLISLNVFYSPNSFGGATIVAEEVNKILAEDHGWKILVVTTHHDGDFPPYSLLKYHAKEVEVVSINLPRHINYQAHYKNDEVAEIFRGIINGFQPSVVHAHSIQKLGATFLEVAHDLKVTSFVTFHDCWWICDRQFMINRHGKYCFQKEIDPGVCMYCVDNINEYERRQKYLSKILEKVDFYLFPSQFHMELHILNGFPADRCRVNKNGVRFPKKNYRKRSAKKIRFGFVGGPGAIKGAEIIRQAFGEIDNKNYEIIAVDAAQNVGKTWKRGFSNWDIKGKLTLVPAYSQATMDSYYRNIDVLLFPSQWKESFGLTVREALSRHIWIVSTDGGGTTEDLVHGENATIIPITMNPEPLRNAVQKLMKQDWQNYRNPHVASIRSYRMQAEELQQIFAEAFK